MRDFLPPVVVLGERTAQVGLQTINPAKVTSVQQKMLLKTEVSPGEAVTRGIVARTHTIKVELELEEFRAGEPIWQTTDHVMIDRRIRVSICGQVGQQTFGQIQDTLRQMAMGAEDSYWSYEPAENWSAGRLLNLVNLWDEWHLNDMNGACIHQDGGIGRRALVYQDVPNETPEGRHQSGPTRRETFNECWNRTYADQIEKCPDRYRWGSAWLTKPLTTEGFASIAAMFDVSFGETVVYASRGAVAFAYDAYLNAKRLKEQG